MDKYHRDVETNMDLVSSLLERSTNVSSMLQYVDSHVNHIPRMDSYIKIDGANCLHCHLSSFVSRFPNESQEVDRIRRLIENGNNTSIEQIDWLIIGTYPINEYNTEGLRDMEFPTLFPTGDVDWLHPII